MTTSEQTMYAFIKEGILTMDSEGRFYTASGKRAENKHSAGYWCLCRKVGGRKSSALAHRMVWIVLHGDIENGRTINHINRVKTDNRPCNLELLSAKDNFLKAGIRGEGHPMVKLKEAQVLEIRSRSSEHVRALAREYGVSQRAIQFILMGRTWKCLLPGYVPGQGHHDYLCHTGTPAKEDAPAPQAFAGLAPIAP